MDAHLFQMMQLVERAAADLLDPVALQVDGAQPAESAERVAADLADLVLVQVAVASVRG